MAQKTISFSNFDNTIGGDARISAVMSHGINPSTGLPLWKVPVATEEDLNEAVTAAQKAFPEWSRRPWKERQYLLAKLKDTLLEYSEEMVELIMQETGKPVSVANQSFDSVNLLIVESFCKH